MPFLDNLKERWSEMLKPRARSAPAELGQGPGDKCDRCHELVMKIDFERNHDICPACGCYRRVDARRRIALTFDENSFRECDADLGATDPLGFSGAKGYGDKLEAARKKTGLLDAVVSGVAKLEERLVAVVATDAAFLMGSMGSVVGERFVRMVELAIRERMPFISISGSGGGARMYEGLFSLMQMAKTSAALARLDAAKLPFISVCTDCTMAGVWASWAALGDVIVAEPDALIGFTGPRVIKETIRVELPEGFQRSEFLLDHGQIDMIVGRKDMRPKLASLLDGMMGRPVAVPAVIP